MKLALPLLLLFSCSQISATLQPSTQPAKITMVELSSFEDDNITALINKIHELQKTSAVYIRINTNGGSVAGMWRLVQALEHNPVTCIVDVKAYSAGAYFLESDACGERLATKRSTILLHEPLVRGVDGNAHELQDEVEQLQALSDSLVATTASRIKMSEKALSAKIYNKTWTMAYAEALKCNVIDRVVDPKDLPEITLLNDTSNSLEDILNKLLK